MRRVAGFLSVVGIASALLLVGVSPASAVDPAPGPVPEVPDIPSKYANHYNPSHLTPGSPAYDDWMQAMRAKVNPPPGYVAPAKPLPQVPKPFAPIAQMTRVVGGASVAVAVAHVTWAAASNGALHLVAIADETDYDTAFCSQPDLYQGAVWALNLGTAPDCKFHAASFSEDAMADTEASFGGTHYRVKALVPYFAGSTLKSWCGEIYQDPSTPYRVRFEQQGDLYSGSSYSATCNDYAAVAPASIHGRTYNTPYRADIIEIYDNNTGEVKDTATPHLVAGADAERTTECTIDWPDGQTTTGQGDTYTEATGVPMSALGLGCEPAFQQYRDNPLNPAYAIPERIRVDSVSEDGTHTEMLDQESPSLTEDELVPYRPDVNAHGLELKKSVGGVVTSCMTWEADCVGWWAATSSGASPSTSSGTYQCTFGGIGVALTQCGVYQNTFDTRTSTPVITDPTTGEDTDWIPAPGAANPTLPGSAQGNANSTDPATSISPGDACFESWPPFSLADPVTWVMHPVYCAIVKAFAPRQAVVDAKFAEAETIWSTKAPAAMIAAAGSIDSLTGPTGCSIPITIFGITADVVNVCDGMMAQLPIFTRLITGAYAVVIVYTKLRQQSAAMINYNVGQT